MRDQPGHLHNDFIMNGLGNRFVWQYDGIANSHFVFDRHIFTYPQSD